MIRIKRAVFILLVLVSSARLFAQAKWDTTYYTKYKDKLVISVFWAWRNFEFRMSQKGVPDSLGKSPLHYLPNTSLAFGAEIDYDKISVSFATRTAIDDSAITNKGKSYYKNLALSVGGNKWILETSYRNFKGFYDNNTYTRDTLHKGKPYIQNSSLNIRQTKAKFLYFLNHKRFAFKAGYGYTCRQLKTSFSFVAGGNFYMNKLTADSSFFPVEVRHYYGNNAYLNSLKIAGVSAGGGGSFNLVLWKKLFVNLTGTIFAEPQWRTYSRISSGSSNVTYVSISTDARASLGYNAKNFFISIYGNWDKIFVNSSDLNITSQQISGAFSIGYRFKVKTPKFYQKIQETKIYKML